MREDEVKHKNVLVLKAKVPSNTEDGTREPFIRYMQSLDRRVPKHIITLDEKYLRRCLELVYASAMRGTSFSSVPASFSLRMSTLFKGASLLDINRRYGYDPCEVVYCSPLETEIVRNKTMGTITRSRGGLSLVKHPLLHQSVSTENNMDERVNLVNADNAADDTVSSSSRLGANSLLKPEKEMAVFESERFKPETEHKRHVSVSSTSCVSDRSSISKLSKNNRGMLHCTWKAGRPHYAFSLDNRSEVYVTNIIKPEPPNNNGFDYIYTFHTNEAYLVGKMRVSTSSKLCRNNREVKETEFVLFGEDETHMGAVQPSTSHNNVKKSKGLSKKMSEVFKTNQGSSASKKALTNKNTNVGLSTSFLPNLELASIIVKEHVCGIRREPEVGGWGMKFLKKTELKKTASSVDTSPSPCEYLVRNNGDCCSTSVDIIIPAGFHGGPWKSIGGPSTLVDRWRSGRKCDCGGWDIGCPITVFNTELSKENHLPQTDIRVCGMQDSAPVMKMVNIRDGLYVIHFQFNLSALQSFSIAVSIIHSQTVQ